VSAVRAELRTGLVYPASDLYRRYQQIATAAGRPPGHPVAFGQALKRHGCLRKKVNRDGRQISGWLV
jgi:hypothetical protein